MSHRAIATPNAPAAIGTYSQAILSGDTLYCSGQIPLDPATMTLVSGDFEAEVTRVFENLKAVLEAAEMGFANVVKANVFLTDFANFATLNEVMQRYVQPPYPARSTVAVAGLPRGVRVEIEVIARR
jgi:reactive intermediate/imine deaminase